MRHEVWVHGLALAGDKPTEHHFGLLLPFTADGQLIQELNPAPDSAPTAGWRAGCGCGWAGGNYYPRAEFPCIDDTDPHGTPPPAVYGNTPEGGGAHVDWQLHLYDALPELTVHDMLRTGRGPTHPDVRDIVAWARQAGASWARIGAVTGLPPTVARALWGPPPPRPTPPAPRPAGRAAERPPQRGPHRPVSGPRRGPDPHAPGQR